MTDMEQFNAMIEHSQYNLDTDRIAIRAAAGNSPSASLFHGSIVSSRRVIYTPSAFARESLLYLQETGSLKAKKPHISARSNLSSFLFFIVRSGSGELSYNGQVTALRPGDCVFIDCRQHYSHSTSNDLWELSWAHFNAQFMPGIYAKYMERGGLNVFHPNDLPGFQGALTALYELASGDDYIRDMKINEALAGLLSLLMRESWHPEKQSGKAQKKEGVRAIRDYLDAHYAEKISLDQLSREHYINKYYLTRVFRDQYGTSIGNYLLHVRITHAKQLLRFTSDSIESVGAAVGIPDPHYFARAFRQVEGMTPNAYRKTW